MSELRLVLLTADHELSGFDCGNDELNRWLIDHALASQKADLARTYLALTDTAVAGYFSLTTGSVRRESAPRRFARGMPRHPIPTILIARLAVDRRHQGQQLGSRLLAEALRLAVAASDTRPPGLSSSMRSMTRPPRSIAAADSSTYPRTPAACSARSATSAELSNISDDSQLVRSKGSCLLLEA